MIRHPPFPFTNDDRLCNGILKGKPTILGDDSSSTPTFTNDDRLRNEILCNGILTGAFTNDDCLRNEFLHNGILTGKSRILGEDSSSSLAFTNGDCLLSRIFGDDSSSSLAFKNDECFPLRIVGDESFFRTGTSWSTIIIYQ